MSQVRKIERKAFFGIVRSITVLLVVIFAAACVGGIGYGVKIWRTHVPLTVTPKDILAQMAPLPASNAANAAATASDSASGPASDSTAGQIVSPTPSALQGYRIPFALQKYISGSNAQVIRSHLDDGHGADHQAYLDELGAVVMAAESRQLNVVDAINQYMKTKGARYADQAALDVKKWETLTLVAEGVGAALLFLIFLSMLLVLLAIEKSARALLRRQPEQGDRLARQEPT